MLDLTNEFNKAIEYKNYTHKSMVLGASSDGRGIGLGAHFLPHKFIRRSSEC